MANYVLSHASHQPAFHTRPTVRAQYHQIGPPPLCFVHNLYPWIPLTDGCIDSHCLVAADNIGLFVSQLLGFGGDPRCNLPVFGGDRDFGEQRIGRWINRLRHREHPHR